jgi:S-adenosylmethionine:tRNA ribosyltransferase-isomerase
MKTEDLDYHLPEDRIALRPARPRDSARLLHVPPSGAFVDCLVRDLPSRLRAGDLLVVNDSRTLHARLHGIRPARGGDASQDVSIEALLHTRVSPDTWRALLKPGKRIKPGDSLVFNADLSAQCVQIGPDGGELRFNQSGAALDHRLEALGEPPLPPYIAGRRSVDDQDKSDYQTVYADKPGSVATPTAGLHFTPGLLEDLKKAGIRRTVVTLHVGLGTFAPVQSDDLKDHNLHAEWGEVPETAAATIEETRAAGGRIVAVGTTTARILESAARDAEGTVPPWSGSTDLFITPGFQWQAVDVLMTNFHLPRSTLLAMIFAFAGEERIRAAYDHAINNHYRFYSYGDACLLER